MSWLQVDGGSLILGALLVLTLPMEWLAAAVLAAVWHEACHAMMVTALGGKVLSLRVGIWGMRMETSPMDPLPGALCALAGPAGSLGLLLLGTWFPRMAAWGLLQGCCNLLPIFPLDGGQIVCCLVPRASPWVEGVALAGLGGLALCGAVWMGTGLFPLAAVVLLAVGRKKPCKSSRFRVQ